MRLRLVPLIALACAGRLHAQSSLALQVDSLAATFVKTAPSASVSVAIMKGGAPLLVRAYGRADVDKPRDATPQSIYEIGSITKQFTASAIMRLAERGKLKLDDDLSQYVPQFPQQGHHVTIRNLLTHTSGIHNYTAKPAWRANWSEDLSVDSIVGFVARDTFDFAPGTKMSYSNTGYVLLGMVIEKASGKPYATFMDEEFFKPLGLTRTNYCPNHPTDADVALGYSKKKDGMLGPADYLSMTHPFSAGALCSTATDIARFEVLFHSGKVVSSTSYQLMVMPTTLNGGTKSNYGFGLAMIDMPIPGSPPRPTITHSGGINGYLSQQIYVPSDSLAVVVLTNTDAAPPGPFAAEIAQMVLKSKR